MLPFYGLCLLVANAAWGIVAGYVVYKKKLYQLTQVSLVGYVPLVLTLMLAGMMRAGTEELLAVFFFGLHYSKWVSVSGNLFYLAFPIAYVLTLIYLSGGGSGWWKKFKKRASELVDNLVQKVKDAVPPIPVPQPIAIRW